MSLCNWSEYPQNTERQSFFRVVFSIGWLSRQYQKCKTRCFAQKMLQACDVSGAYKGVKNWEKRKEKSSMDCLKESKVHVTNKVFRTAYFIAKNCKSFSDYFELLELQKLNGLKLSVSIGELTTSSKRVILIVYLKCQSDEFEEPRFLGFDSAAKWNRWGNYWIFTSAFLNMVSMAIAWSRTWLHS